MITLIFSWWMFGLTVNKLQDKLESINLKFASMCIGHIIGETQCYDGINQLTDMKFKLAVDNDNKVNNRKILQKELEDFVAKYGVR